MNKKYFIGQRFYSKKWGVASIKELLPNCHGLVQFHGNFPFVVKASLSNLKKGFVRNPMQPTVYGVGVFGTGEYTSKHPAYNTWVNLLQRCYSNRFPTYNGVKVSDECLNFQTFAKDYEQMLDGCLFSDIQVDKDLFSSSARGMLYSKETCCILPHKINTALQLTNVLSEHRHHGVSKHYDGRQRAQISINGSNTHIAVSDDVEVVREAYLKSKNEYLIRLANEYSERLPQRTKERILVKIKEFSNAL